MLDHPKGAGSEGDIRLDFDPRVRLEFHGSKISSDGGLLLFRELDETLGLHDLAGRSLRDTRTGKNGIHNFVGLLRQSSRRGGQSPPEPEGRRIGGGLDPERRRADGADVLDTQVAGGRELRGQRPAAEPAEQPQLQQQHDGAFRQEHHRRGPW